MEREESFNRIMEVIISKKDLSPFESSILATVSDIASMDIPRAEKDKLYELVVETVERQAAIEANNGRAAEHFRQMLENLQRIIDATTAFHNYAEGVNKILTAYREKQIKEEQALKDQHDRKN